MQAAGSEGCARPESELQAGCEGQQSLPLEVTQVTTFVWIETTTMNTQQRLCESRDGEKQDLDVSIKYGSSLIASIVLVR